MTSYGADPNAPKDPNCVACQNDWPIFVNPDTGIREHIDLFDTYDAGISERCPTQNPRWKDEDETEAP